MIEMMASSNRIVHQEGMIRQEGKYIIYWMQQAQRIEYNHALNYAIMQANEHQKPLLIYFGLTPNYPDANARHYTFMLEGLSEVIKRLEEMGIRVCLHLGEPEDGLIQLMDKAAAVVMDEGHMKIQRAWREKVRRAFKNHNNLMSTTIETDLMIPVEIVSDHMEVAARTIRRKWWEQFPAYDNTVSTPPLDIKATDREQDEDQLLEGEHELRKALQSVSSIRQWVTSLPIDQTVQKSPVYHGGRQAALSWLTTFIETALTDYKDDSPVRDHTSKMSPYLHFGQIASLEIYHRVREAVEKGNQEGRPYDMESVRGYYEQIGIRRELAYNYIHYNTGYDTFDTMTDDWAYQTMAMHRADERSHLYSKEEMENFETHDPYWNEAMEEMVTTGYMHNYMRMYWCKKIIEWTPDYRTAYKWAIEWNNKYFLDGRDANGYTGVAWCFGKHDHGWKERAVFGKLRYMNTNGLFKRGVIKRKMET